MGQNLASEQSKDHGCEKLVEMPGCRWEEENSEAPTQWRPRESVFVKLLTEGEPSDL